MTRLLAGRERPRRLDRERWQERQGKFDADGEGSEFPHSERPVYDRPTFNARAAS
jgi:hypothetical protein